MRIQIGHDSLIGIVSNSESDNTKRQLIENSRIMFAVFLGQIVKIVIAFEDPIQIFVFTKAFHFICLFCRQQQVNKQVKLLRFRQIKTLSNPCRTCHILNTNQIGPAFFLNMSH